MEDVHQLRTFRAVAQQLSFTRAAESLFLTQSAVSHQIAAVERSLNTPLFVRQGRSVTLTAAGRALLGQTTKVFHLLDEYGSRFVRQAAPAGTGAAADCGIDDGLPVSDSRIGARVSGVVSVVFAGDHGGGFAADDGAGAAESGGPRRIIIRAERNRSG